MKKNGGCLGEKIGVFLLMVSFVFLPMTPALSLASDAPIAGPSTERAPGKSGEDAKPGSEEAPIAGPSTEREPVGRGGDAGPGASKGMKSYKWWWIGGAVVAVGAIAAAAGGGGGGGGSTPSH